MVLSICSCRREALAGTARVTRAKASRRELMELFLCDADVEVKRISELRNMKSRLRE